MRREIRNNDPVYKLLKKHFKEQKENDKISKKNNTDKLDNYSNRGNPNPDNSEIITRQTGNKDKWNNDRAESNIPRGRGN